MTQEQMTQTEHQVNMNKSDFIQRSVYLLAKDGHRDSVNLQHCAMDDEGLKKILIEEMSEIGQSVIMETINIKHDECGGSIFYEYKHKYFGNGEVEEGKCGFFKLNLV